MKKIIILCIVGVSLLGVNASANDVLIDENGNVITGNANVNDGNLEVLTTGEDAVVGITSGAGKSGVYGESEDSGYGIQGVSDSGTGGYFSSTSGYGLIVETGNVGLGTTSPNPLYKLDVIGTINASTDIKVNGVSVLTSFTETDPVFSGSDAFGLTSVQITNWDTAFSWGNHASAGYDTTNDTWQGTEDVYTTSGKVGVGTAVPYENLHIVDSPGATGGWVVGSDLMIESGYYQRYITIRGPNSGQTGILFSNSDSQIDGGLRYWPSSTTGNDRLEILSGGNYDAFNVMGDGRVGIGTAIPEYKLDIQTNGVYALKAESSGSETIMALENTSTNGRDWWFVSGGASGAASGGRFAIYDASGGGSRLTIDTVGNLGIGTTTPSEKLDVNGNANVGGNLTVTGDINVTQQNVAFRSYSSSDQAAHSGWALVNFTNEDFDEGSVFNATNDRFTVPYDGVYQINGTATVISSNGSDLLLAVYVNNQIKQYISRMSANGAALHTLSGSITLKLTAGDYIELKQYCSMTCAIKGTLGGYYTSFSGSRIY